MFKNFLQSKCPQTVYIRLNQIVSLCFNTLISKPIHSEEDIETLDYDVMPFIYLIFFYIYQSSVSLLLFYVLLECFEVVLFFVCMFEDRKA